MRIFFIISLFNYFLYFNITYVFENEKGILKRRFPEIRLMGIKSSFSYIISSAAECEKDTLHWEATHTKFQSYTNYIRKEAGKNKLPY